MVFDAAGGEIGGAAFDITARGGRFQAYGAASGDFAALPTELVEERGITLVGIHQPSTYDWKQMPERALVELAAGRVSPLIGLTFPLERAADAHTAIEARATLGKTLLLA